MSAETQLDPPMTDTTVSQSPPEQAAQSDVVREAIRSEIINAPETADFMAGVPLEAAHQRERWGADHDAGKAPLDWFWLIGYLAQKAATAQMAGDTEKALHHTISTGAALANWHAAISGKSTAMRPGIEPPDALRATASLAATPPAPVEGVSKLADELAALPIRQMVLDVDAGTVSTRQETVVPRDLRDRILAALRATASPAPDSVLLPDVGEVVPCMDATGSRRVSWDICLRAEPNAPGRAVIASCYGTREQAEAMASALSNRELSHDWDMSETVARWGQQEASDSVLPPDVGEAVVDLRTDSESAIESGPE